jgi:hypothetical protein
MENLRIEDLNKALLQTTNQERLNILNKQLEKSKKFFILKLKKYPKEALRTPNQRI